MTNTRDLARQNEGLTWANLDIPIKIQNRFNETDGDDVMQYDDDGQVTRLDRADFALFGFGANHAADYEQCLKCKKYLTATAIERHLEQCGSHLQQQQAQNKNFIVADCKGSLPTSGAGMVMENESQASNTLSSRTGSSVLSQPPLQLRRSSLEDDSATKCLVAKNGKICQKAITCNVHSLAEKSTVTRPQDLFALIQSFVDKQVGRRAEDVLFERQSDESNEQRPGWHLYGQQSKQQVTVLFEQGATPAPSNELVSRLLKHADALVRIRQHNRTEWSRHATKDLQLSWQFQQLFSSSHQHNSKLMSGPLSSRALTVSRHQLSDQIFEIPDLTASEVVQTAAVATGANTAAKDKPKKKRKSQSIATVATGQQQVNS